MADDLVTGGTEDPAPSPPGDAALGALAKDDDASRYIEERQSQDAEEHGLEPETPKQERQSHIEQALEEARKRSAEAREQEQQLDDGLAAAEQEWQQQQQQEQAAQRQYANQLSYAEAQGRCMERASQLKRSNPQLHKTISDNLALVESVLDRDQAKALEAALVYHTDAIWRLGQNLSDDEFMGTLSNKLDMIRQATPLQIWQGAVEGAANLRQEAYVQRRILEDRVAQGRRVTQAPPPLSRLNGSTNAPRDMYRTAEKSDASDYIKMRRAQNARAERD
jgi:hypothetical protein